MKKMCSAAAVVLVLVALVAVLIIVNRPDPGHEFWQDFSARYPGIPASAATEDIAKARQLCDAGTPESWWITWPQAPVNADFWNLAITHLCPEQSAHRVSVAP